MVNRTVGKTLFAIVVAASLVSVGALSYLYFQGGQEAYSGDDEDDGPVAGDDDSAVQNLAPDFSYTAVDGGAVRLSGLIGNVVILDFMAMWCQPCGTQMDYLRVIYSEYAADGVTIISLDIDTAETAEDLLQYQNEKGAAWDFVIDSDEVNSEPEYNVQSIPTLVIVKRDGTVATRNVGVMDSDALRDVIDPLL